jgi:hypothetical protein
MRWIAARDIEPALSTNQAGVSLGAIQLIETWVEEAGSTDKAILQDLKARSAIERQLLIISEAAIHLGKLDPTAVARLAPSVD